MLISCLQILKQSSLGVRFYVTVLTSSTFLSAVFTLQGPLINRQTIIHSQNKINVTITLPGDLTPILVILFWCFDQFFIAFSILHQFFTTLDFFHKQLVYKQLYLIL